MTRPNPTNYPEQDGVIEKLVKEIWIHPEFQNADLSKGAEEFVSHAALKIKTLIQNKTKTAQLGGKKNGYKIVKNLIATKRFDNVTDLEIWIDNQLKKLKGKLNAQN